MKLSKKAEYALRALLAMARAPAGTNFSIHDLATGEHIPLKFLEQILLALRNGGLLRSKRGVGGGYQLQKPAAHISLREIIHLMDGPFEPVACSAAVDKPGLSCACGVPGGCGLGHAFAGLRNEVDAWLTSTTLEGVLALEKKPETLSFDI